MLKILNRLLSILGRKKEYHFNPDERSFYLLPFQIPQKRWPAFLFKGHNERVEVAKIIFKNFQYDRFFNANKKLTYFQNCKEPIDNSKDILSWIQSEELEVNRLRTSFECFTDKPQPKSLSSFLNSVNTNIKTLEKMVQSQRRHARISLYLNEEVCRLLHDVETDLLHMFSYLEEESLNELPYKLNDWHEKLLLLKTEGTNSDYQFHTIRIASTIELIEDIVQGNTNFSYNEVKKILQPWFHEFNESELCLEQCIRRLLTHFIVPHIKTVSDKRLGLIRQFHPYWADAITHRLMSENLKAHMCDKSATHDRSKQKETDMKLTLLNTFCFWIEPDNDGKYKLRNAQARAFNLESQSLRKEMQLH